MTTAWIAARSASASGAGWTCEVSTKYGAPVVCLAVMPMTWCTPSAERVSTLNSGPCRYSSIRYGPGSPAAVTRSVHSSRSAASRISATPRLPEARAGLTTTGSGRPASAPDTSSAVATETERTAERPCAASSARIAALSLSTPIAVAGLGETPSASASA